MLCLHTVRLRRTWWDMQVTVQIEEAAGLQPHRVQLSSYLFRRLALMRSMLQSQWAEPTCLTAGGGSTARRTWLIQQSPL